ncbi:MAG: hypothetical protein M0P70_10450 [Desulfobulbaceae bacterium]|nr:hypothetical protein [Desulfobulbaceae bacterium]
MKQLIRTMAAVCLTILFLAAAVGAQQAQENKNTKVDLEKTAALYLQWSSRPSFPESTPFAYYTVYAMRALGKEMPKETRGKIVSFLKSCQKPDGGFANEPKFAPASNIIFTYYCLQTLDLLGEFGAIDQNKVLAYLLALQQPAGGFKASAGEKEKPSLAATFYGVSSLSLLKKLDAVNKEKTAAFVAAFKEQDKGFGFVPGKLSAPTSTFMAVRTLKVLGMLTDEVKSGVSAYLRDTRYAGHVTDRKYYSPPTLQDLAEVLKTLRDLSALEVADLAKVNSFIESLYVAENSGFGPQPGYGTTPPSTFYGIVCLVQLGKLPDPMP